MMHRSKILLASLLAASAFSVQAEVPVSGDPVLFWNQVAMTDFASFSGPDSDPGLTGRSYAIVNIAMHDAVNATVGFPDRSYVGGVSASGGDTRAAAAVAAHDVLVGLYPSQTAVFDKALSDSLSLVPSGAAKAAGIATGKAFAAATLASRANDGFNSTPPPYVPTGQPGNYVPIPVAIDQQFATATPFVMTSDSQFRAGPPPALNGPDGTIYAAALNQIEAIGSATSTVRTQDQTNSALFWEHDPERPYLAAAIDQSIKTGKSTLENARILATLTTAVADAPIAAFDTKYVYDFWRPITAIHEADLDGNDATTADPDWTPLLTTPPFPGYFSAHAIVGGTAASILDAEYGNSNGFCFDNAVGSRCWDSYDAASEDDAESRLWGGVHFGFENDLGRGTGYQLGAFAISQAIFGAVPEPASWTMMIVGFGLVGASARRTRRCDQRLVIA